MPHSLPPLPYAYDALAPVLSEEAMRLHHDKHHQAYVDNLNKALAGHPEFAETPVDELLKNLQQLPEDLRTPIRNHGGGQRPGPGWRVADQHHACVPGCPARRGIYLRITHIEHAIWQQTQASGGME